MSIYIIYFAFSKKVLVASLIMYTRTKQYFVYNGIVINIISFYN